MAEGPIPFSAVDRYARRYGIVETDEFDRLLTVVMAMDAEFRSSREDRRKQAAELQAKLDKQAHEDGPPKPQKKPRMLSREMKEDRDG